MSHIDCQNDSVYTLYSKPNSGNISEYLSTILHGSTNININTIQATATTGFTHSFIDVKNKNYILVENTGVLSKIQIRGINYKSGQQAYSYTVTLPGSQAQMRQVMFNCIDNRLYGLYIPSPSAIVPTRLIKINLSTGDTALGNMIGTYPTFIGHDPISSGNYMYFGAGSSPNNSYLYTLNVATQQIEDSIPYPNIGGGAFIPYQCSSKADFEDTVACASIPKRFRYTGSGQGRLAGN